MIQTSTAVSDVLAAASILIVWQQLGGGPLRHGRGKAFWRNGDGQNISLVEARNVWKDHVTGEGGGVLDLIALVNGGTRQDALRWLADSTGVALDDRAPDPAAKAEWVAIERDKPLARLWTRAMLGMTDDLLTRLKAALFDPTMSRPECGEIAALESFYRFLHEADEAGIVKEYRQWRDKWPSTTAGMIHAMKRREQAEKRALSRFLQQIECEPVAA